MAFPTTGILTNFTGADEDPLSEGGAFAGPMQNGVNQLRRVSNAVANPTAGNAIGQSYRVGLSAADLECYATVPTLPTGTDGVACWARLQNPGNATTAAAYLAVYTNGTGFRLFKLTAGVTFTQLGSTSATTMAAGEKLGIEVIGTSIKCKLFTGGSWVDKVTATDGAVTGAGTIGLEINCGATSAVPRMDDMGGGAVVTGPPIGSLGLLGVGA